MDVSEVLVLTHIRCGDKFYEKGSVFKAPIPSHLMNELRANTGTVRVIQKITPVPQQKIPQIKLESEEKMENKAALEEVKEKLNLEPLVFSTPPPLDIKELKKRGRKFGSRNKKK